MTEARVVGRSRKYMKYEEPKMEWILLEMLDVITSSVGDDGGLSMDENEGGKYEGLPGL